MNSGKSKESYPMPFAEPGEVGFAAERLARIRPRMQKFVDEGKAPMIVTLVARHGKIVHYDAQGYMDLEKKKPVQKDTLFRLWSNTKPITGVATMICVEEGLLNLDDPVSRFIPTFKNPVVRVTQAPPQQESNRPPAMMTTTVPANREITVRDCLRNTTGLASTRTAPLAYLTEFRDTIKEAGLLVGLEGQSGDVRKTVEALGKIPLEAQPGTEFLYHAGYPVVGIVLETAIGQSLEDFYRERIFEPLGMKDSSLYLPESKLDRFPVCYRPARDGGKWTLAISEMPETSQRLKGPRAFFDAGGGGGGVVSTITDYARFSQMLLNGGELDGVRILGRKSVEMMTSSHTGDIPILSGPGFGFGIGVGVYKGGGMVPQWRSIGTFGWSGAAGTTLFMDPKEDLLAACFTQVMMHNSMPGGTYHEDFERIVYQALL